MKKISWRCLGTVVLVSCLVSACGGGDNEGTAGRPPKCSSILELYKFADKCFATDELPACLHESCRAIFPIPEVGKYQCLAALAI